MPDSLKHITLRSLIDKRQSKHIMSKSCSDLAKIIDRFSPADGEHESPVSGVCCLKFSQPGRASKLDWYAGLGIIAQGSREIVLARDVHRYSEGQYIATPIDLPVVSRAVSASREKPFLCLLIAFDGVMLSEAAAQLETDFPKTKHDPQRTVFIGKASNRMMDASIRLAELFETAEEAPVLAPLIIKEMIYYLLKGPDGAAIRQFVRAGSWMHKISRAIYRLRSELGDEVSISDLARDANMSRAAFFGHFKEMTTISPIQYQKRLRLLKAREVMIETVETAESSAFKVGYKSASQFNREYSRMFGESPLRNVIRIKNVSDSFESD